MRKSAPPRRPGSAGVHEHGDGIPEPRRCGRFKLGVGDDVAERYSPVGVVLRVMLVVTSR